VMEPSSTVRAALRPESGMVCVATQSRGRPLKRRGLLKRGEPIA
jgi:hypothetical protein